MAGADAQPYPGFHCHCVRKDFSRVMTLVIEKIFSRVARKQSFGSGIIESA